MPRVLIIIVWRPRCPTVAWMRWIPGWCWWCQPGWLRFWSLRFLAVLFRFGFLSPRVGPLLLLFDGSPAGRLGLAPRIRFFHHRLVPQQAASVFRWRLSKSVGSSDPGRVDPHPFQVHLSPPCVTAVIRFGRTGQMRCAGARVSPAWVVGGCGSGQRKTPAAVRPAGVCGNRWDRLDYLASSILEAVKMCLPSTSLVVPVAVTFAVLLQRFLWNALETSLPSSR